MKAGGLVDDAHCDKIRLTQPLCDGVKFGEQRSVMNTPRQGREEHDGSYQIFYMLFQFKE